MCIRDRLEVSVKDIDEAEERLNRFAPFIRKCFPETEERQGIIESPLTPIPEMQHFLNDAYGEGIEGNLLLKQDSHLAVAGSVKARGGIYEVLKHTEELALREGLLTVDDDYAKLASEECREFFSQYTMQVLSLIHICTVIYTGFSSDNGVCICADFIFVQYRNGNRLQFGKQHLPWRDLLCDEGAFSGTSAWSDHGLLDFPDAQLSGTAGAI